MSQAALVDPTAMGDGIRASTVETRSLSLYYGSFHALKNVNIAIHGREITALIGPSGCGKSTLLRVFNRMNDLIPGARINGEVLIDGQDIYRRSADLIALRKKVGMVFQRPNPFPISVFQNVAYGPNIHGMAFRQELEAIVERNLRATGLWDDLKDKLHVPALSLSAEQQQRLCISRLLAVEPEVLLMDEPCSALDPIATARIEDLLFGLKQNYTIIIVTHNMQQAARISSRAGFMLLGDLVEVGATETIFTNPQDQRTQDYITGRFG